MTATLQLSQPPNTTAAIISLLAHYRMMPQLLREIIIDQAIAEVTCTPEEQAIACGQFYQQHQLVGEQERQAWLKRHGFTLKQLAESVIRELKIEKFKQATWESQLESYFLTRKGQWDKVIYSVIHVKDRNLAQELYFRLVEGEQSFAELAKEYSPGPEQVARQALTDPQRGYGKLKVQVDADALAHLINVANGDARALLNALELAVETTPPDRTGTIHIPLAVAEESIQRRALLYDKEGDAHFDTISAFIKSLREVILMPPSTGWPAWCTPGRPPLYLPPHADSGK